MRYWVIKFMDRCTFIL